MQPLPNRLAFLVPGTAQWLATVSALCDLLILLHHPSTFSLPRKSIEVDARSPRPSLSFIVLVYQAFLSESRFRTVQLPLLFLNVFPVLPFGPPDIPPQCIPHSTTQHAFETSDRSR